MKRAFIEIQNDESSEEQDERRQKLASPSSPMISSLQQSKNTPLMIASNTFHRSNREHTQRVINVINWLNRNRPEWPGSALPRELIPYIGHLAKDTCESMGIVDENNTSDNGRIIYMTFDIENNNNDVTRTILHQCEAQFGVGVLCDIDYYSPYESSRSFTRFIFRWFIYNEPADKLKKSLEFICDAMDKITQDIVYNIQNSENTDIDMGVEMENIRDYDDEYNFEAIFGIFPEDFVDNFNMPDDIVFSLWSSITQPSKDENDEDE